MSLEQKEICTEVAQDLSEIANNDPYFPQKVIAGDGYDPWNKAQSSQRNSSESPCPK